MKESLKILELNTQSPNHNISKVKKINFLTTIMQNILKLTNKISKFIVKPSVSFCNGTNTSCTHFSSKVTNFPKYKLIYFDVRAVGEPIRLIFAYAKVPYEDKRIPFKEWPAIKKCK